MNARRLTLWCIAALLCSAAISENGPGTGRPPGTIQLHGAGATFPAPLYKKWLEEYRKRQPTVEVSYDPIGSGDGVKQFMAGLVDFGASDAAMTDAEMAGVAGRIKISKGAIGYVEYGIARRAGLSMAWLENKAGEVIRPHGGSGLATLLSMDMPENFRAFEPDPDGEESYPIVTYSWLLLYKGGHDPQKATALKQYVTWCLTDGQEFNESLGFVRLPPRIATRAERAVDTLQ
jgi:ABC-type phosphate transport system substrate-binding protein